MAQFTNTHDSYDIKGMREDLTDDIFRVTPSDTPFLSAIGRTKATNPYHEWQTHALGAALTNNYQIEGDEFAYTEPTATTRVGNRCQISTKQFLITGTAEVVSKAGRDSEIAFQKIAKSLELRRDMETSVIGTSQASVTGSSGAARRLGSLNSWLTTNDFGTPGAAPNSRGTSGVAGGFSTNNTVAPTDGTTRAVSQAMLDGVVGKIWENSGSVDDALIMAGAQQKANITGFDGIASQVQTNSKDRVIMATADVYASQFGDMKIVPNRYIRKTATVDREVYIVRPAFAKLAILRPIQEIRPAVTGDAEKRVMLVEYTLEVCNEAAHGILCDLS